MLQSGIATTFDEECFTMTVEPVRVEDPEGTLIVSYPSKIDLEFEDDTIQIIRTT